MKIFKITTCCFSLICLTSLAAHNHEDDCPKFPGHCSSYPVGGDVALALDYFRSLPDGSWNGNTGIFSSLNLALGFPGQKRGFGAQAGGSYGVYDWDGRGSVPGGSKALQQQGFLTLGLFRRTPDCKGLNAGLVYDFMFNKKFGVFGTNPQLAQLRGQLGYLCEGRNEFGFWGTYDTQSSHRDPDEIPLKFRAVCQANLFWCHYFKNNGQTTLWAGTPYRRGLMYTDGRAGRYIFGGSFRAPLTKALSIIAHGSYMAARNDPATIESKNYAANVCFGVNYSFGGCEPSQRPYLALADNSNFIVDTNLNE